MDIKKWLAYQKAYTNSPLWPIAIWLRKPIFKQMAIEASQLSARGWLLDLGTGPGYLPIEIAQTCPHVDVIGLDIARPLIEDSFRKVNKKHLESRVHLLNASAEFLPFVNNTFDTVQSMFSFHLWSDKQLGIHEIWRVLKPGGKARIVVGRQYLRHGFEVITDLFTKRSISKVRNLCLIAGFSEIIITGKGDFLYILITK